MKESRKNTAARTRIDLESMGARIRGLRGFYQSQTEFARRIGITQSHLSALERGIKEPGATVLLAISREFGKSVDWLLTGEVAPPDKKKR